MVLGLGGGGANDIRIRYLADTTQVGQATAEMGSGISKGLGLAGIGWAAAGAAAVGFAKQSVDAAMQAEEAQAHLADTYARFPALHDVSLKALNDLADATLRKTRYDDEAARAAEGMLAQYHLTGSQIMELLPLVEDFAAKTGKDLPAAAQAVGKALLGQTRGLVAVGIKYKSTGDAATDYANIVRLLHEQVGGAAAADLDTTAGRLEQLKNQYGELKEKLGAALLPLIQQLAPALIAILNVLAMSFEGWGKAMTWVGEQGTLIKTIFGGLGSLWTELKFNAEVIAYAFGELGGAIADVAETVWGALRTAWEWLVQAFKDVWGVIVDVANAVGGFFAGAWHAAESAINAVASAVEWLGSKLQWLKGLWNSVSGFIGKLGKLVGLSAPAPAPGYAIAPGLSPSSYGAPRAVSGPTSSSGINVSVTIHGNVGDANLIGRRTVEALSTYVRTNGARALARRARDHMSSGRPWQDVLGHRVELSEVPTTDNAPGALWGLARWGVDVWGSSWEPPFSDVTADALSIHSTSGAIGLGLAPGVGSIEIELVDLEGRYSPDGATDWLLGRHVRGFLTPLGRPESPAFYGVIAKVAGGGTFSVPVLKLTAYDVRSVIGAAVSLPVANAPQRADERIAAIAYAAGLPTGQTLIGEDPTALLADETEELGDLFGRTIQSAAGIAWADAQGRVVTLGRDWIHGTAPDVELYIYAGEPPGAAPDAVVAQTTGDLDATESIETVANVVTYANIADPPQSVTVRDAGSVRRFGYRRSETRDLAADEALLGELAARELKIRRAPHLVVDGATVTVYDEATARAAALQLGAMVRVGRNDPGVAVWEITGPVAGLDLSITPDRCEVGITVPDLGALTGSELARWGSARWGVSTWVGFSETSIVDNETAAGAELVGAAT